MIELAVGAKFPAFAGKPEGTYFDIDDSGATLVLNYIRPTPQELSSVEASQPFQIKMLAMNGVIWLLTKCGSMPWNDSPYTPHLSTNLTKLTLPEENQGLSLTLIMLDASTNTVKHLRLIGLGYNFSRSLISEITDLWSKPFDRCAYDAEVSRIMYAYTTTDLVKIARIYFKIK